MKIDKLFPSKYVAAADLPPGGITVTIDRLTIEEMRNHDNEKETKPVLWFVKATKGMVLNRTNGMIVAGLYGDETDDWRGKRIQLYPTKVRAFGKMQDAIRVRERRFEPQSNVPMVEASEIDEPDDVLDYEEVDFRAVDASTGEILPDATQTPRSAPLIAPDEVDFVPRNANPFEDAPEPPRGTITPKTLKRLHALGNTLYDSAEEWDKHRPDIILSITTGATKSAADLLEEEALRLCAFIEARIAKKNQPDAQPQAA